MGPILGWDSSRKFWVSCLPPFPKSTKWERQHCQMLENTYQSYGIKQYLIFQEKKVPSLEDLTILVRNLFPKKVSIYTMAFLCFKTFFVFVIPVKTSWHFNSAQNLQMSRTSISSMAEHTKLTREGQTFLWCTPASIKLVDLSGLQGPHFISDCMLAVIPSLASSHLEEEDLMTSNSHLYALKLASHCRIREQILPIFRSGRFGWIQPQIRTDTFSHVYMSKLSLDDSTEIWHFIHTAHTQTSPAISDAPKYLLVSSSLDGSHRGWIPHDLCCNHKLLGIPWTPQKRQQIPELRHQSGAFSSWSRGSWAGGD